MKKTAIFILTWLFIMCFVVVARADNEPQRMKFTCYTEPTFSDGMTTASGKPLRYGICASTSEHLGDCAMLYLVDEEGKLGDFIGYFESLDTGGTEGIRNGYVIDVYEPRYSDAKYMMRVTSGEVFVVWVDNPQG